MSKKDANKELVTKYVVWRRREIDYWGPSEDYYAREGDYSERSIKLMVVVGEYDTKEKAMSKLANDSDMITEVYKLKPEEND